MAQNGAQNERADELRRIFSAIDDDVRSLVSPLLDETIALESRLDELRGMPMIRVHPRDPYRQKATEAAKLYKDYLQRYTENMKTLLGILRKNAPEEVSPLRQWLEERQKQRETV